MTTTLLYWFVLGAIFFVHVFGHFVGARLVGVRVLRLSLGIGPKLVKVRRGDTEYCIGAVPLGGYLKMAGEAADEPRTGAPDEFLSKTKLQRFQLLILGFVMNILLAIVLQAVVLAQDSEVPLFLDEAPTIGFVGAGSPAEKAGIKAGDRIVSVDGKATHTWAALDTALGTNAGQDVTVAFLREGERRSARVRAVRQNQYDIDRGIGIRPDVFLLVGETVPGAPADKAGVKAGDELRAVDGERLFSPEDVRNAVSKKAGVEVDLTIARNGVEQHIVVTPDDRDGVGVIGVFPTVPTKTVARGPMTALQESVRATYQASVMMFATLKTMLDAESIEQLEGPVAVRATSRRASQTSLAFLSFIATLSVWYAFISLLPVPVICDGLRFLSLLRPDVKNENLGMRA